MLKRRSNAPDEAEGPVSFRRWAKWRREEARSVILQDGHGHDGPLDQQARAGVYGWRSECVHMRQADAVTDTGCDQTVEGRSHRANMDSQAERAGFVGTLSDLGTDQAAAPAPWIFHGHVSDPIPTFNTDA